MHAIRLSDAAWAAATAATVAALLFAPVGMGAMLTFMLAAAWCAKIDREEHAVQIVGSVELALNR